MSKNTLVIGASTKPERYSYLAIEKLRKHGHKVIAVGRRPGVVSDVNIETEYKNFEDVHTVTIYINESNQDGLFKYFKLIKPKRVIFNPGTENPILCSQLKKQNIECVHGCTLVMLSVDQY